MKVALHVQALKNPILTIFATYTESIETGAQKRAYENGHR